MLQVVAAVLFRGEKFFIGRRPETKRLGGLWEFPGGKVEAGETEKAAQVRECREELGVEVRVGKRFMRLRHAYPDGEVSLTLYFASVEEGEIKLKEHTDGRFISAKEIGAYAFCPADLPALQKLADLFAEKKPEEIK